MQSADRMDPRGGKKRQNPRNSFVPEDNSPSNEFLSHNSRVSQKPPSNLSPQNSRKGNQSPRIKRPSRESQISSPKASKNQKPRARNHQRMEVIHEENINMKMDPPQKQKFKKNTMELNNEVETGRRSPIISEYQNPINIQQTQSNVIEEEESAPEQKKIRDVNAGMEKLSESILDLRSKYRQLEQQEVKHQARVDHKHKEPKEIIQNHSKEKMKNAAFGERPPEEIEREYKDFLKNQSKEKVARKKVLEQIAEKDKIKLEQYRREKEQRKEAERMQRFNEIKQLHNFSDKHKRMKEIDEQRKQAIQQFMKKYEGKQYLALRREKEDRQKKEEMLEQQKQFLVERKQMFKPIDFQEIDEHQKWYLDKIEALNAEKREIKNVELKKIEEQNAGLPEFWKGKAHNVALEERLEKARKKKQPKEKIKRINQYRAYVRQNFVPRTYENKSLQNSQLRNQSSLTHRQIKRFRYYKGMSYGEVIETRPIAKSTEEIKRMGGHNFEYMKKLPKKQSNSQMVEAYELKLMEQRSRGREEHFLPEEERRTKNTKIVLPESVKSDELVMVMKKLKANDLKLKNQQYALNSQPLVLNDLIDQRKINDELIENIERKLSLLAQL